MKAEVQVARDTSLSVPKCNPVFKIRSSKTPAKPSRQLTAVEFGQNLKALIEKKLAASGKVVTIASFMENLDKIQGH